MQMRMPLPFKLKAMLLVDRQRKRITGTSAFKIIIVDECEKLFHSVTQVNIRKVVSLACNSYPVVLESEALYVRQRAQEKKRALVQAQRPPQKPTRGQLHARRHHRRYRT